MKSMAVGSYLLVLLASINSISAKDVVYEWNLGKDLGNAKSPDCMNVQEARRYLFVAEHSLPGPIIEADEGDTIHVKITNKDAEASVGMHFHGMHQVGTPYSDGPIGLNQCAVGAYQSFEYVFTAYPPGTHYWHVHSSMYFADGLTGPIVVRPKEPEPFSSLYEAEDEMIVFLQDWYIETGSQQLAGLSNWPFTWIGNPNSILINGKGIAPECLPGGANFNNSRVCLSSCQNSTSDLLETFTVESGKTYRLRIINSAQLVMLSFAIAGHNLTIVQVEGTNIEPLTVSSIDISPGQRYDVLLTADQDPGTYWMETSVRERDAFDLFGQAIVKYSTSTSDIPDSGLPNHPAWNDTIFGENQQDSIKSLNISSQPADVVSALSATETEIKRYILVGTQNVYTKPDGSNLLRWAINNISSHRIGAEPLIARAYSDSKSDGWPTTIRDTVTVPENPPFVWDYTDLVGNDGGPGDSLGLESEAIVPLEDGQVFEFVLQNARALNGVAEFHPWHSHGYSFYVVGRGTGIYDPDRDIASYNLENPVLRDTVTLYPLNWVAIRFKANNPGVWFFHCHIVSHHAMGMGITLVEQPDRMDDPADMLSTCPGSLFPKSNPDDDTEIPPSSSMRHLVGLAWGLPLFLTTLLL